MKYCKHLQFVILFIFSSISSNLIAQIQPGVYIADLENETHELKINDTYFIHSVYEKSPANFIKTFGGLYDMEDDLLKLKLEFNSEFQKDSLKTIEIPVKFDENTLELHGKSKITFTLQIPNFQDLDGAWLFATRGPDEGQKRRGEANSRKTLKFLTDGRFQWVAYDTKGMQFKGTGGGSYASKNGVYTENIEYFSRDNSRVGASLEFNYELKEDDWHHTGKNSKGEPMYEIWAKR